MTTILPDRLERFLSDEVHLVKGKGAGANGAIDVCAVQAADWLSGGDGKSDKPACVSRKIGAFVMRLNDSLLFDEHRDLLRPYCERIVGTAGPNGEREVRRAYLLADYAARVFAPIWLRADPQHRFDTQADALESLAPITDEPTRKAAWNAASAASAADAAYAASAADADYAASAADAADAAYAADAATAASAAYAVRKRVTTEHGDLLRAKALECLDALLAVE